MVSESLLRLEKWFAPLKGSITAFSGGIDSALTLYLSHLYLRDKAIGCISVSPSLKRQDYSEAMEFCSQYDIHLEIIETKETEDQNYLSNPSNRCYFCKSHLYADISALKHKYPTYVLLNGTNRDDYGDYRPGLKAASEHDIQSPLADCELSKSDVRALAKHFALPNWDKPASPCLSSRVPYGTHITLDKLKQIEEAESVLNRHGFAEVRVRHLGSIARIEVPPEDILRLQEYEDSINLAFRSLGFESSEIDMEGLVSGKLNRAIRDI